MMNNFELHTKALAMSAATSEYSLARKVIELQEEVEQLQSRMKKSETPVPIEHLIRLQDEVRKLRDYNQYIYEYALIELRVASCALVKATTLHPEFEKNYMRVSDAIESIKKVKQS